MLWRQVPSYTFTTAFVCIYLSHFKAHPSARCISLPQFAAHFASLGPSLPYGHHVVLHVVLVRDVGPAPDITHLMRSQMQGSGCPDHEASDEAEDHLKAS